MTLKGGDLAYEKGDKGFAKHPKQTKGGKCGKILALVFGVIRTSVLCAEYRPN